MISSAYQLTYDPAGAATVLVAFGEMIDQELEYALDKAVEVVQLVDGAAPFVRVAGNAAVTFQIRRYRKEPTDKEARAAVLDSLIAAQTATKKPLRIEVDGYPDRYWEFSNATIKAHKPARHLESASARWVQTTDVVATGLAYTRLLTTIAFAGDSITNGASGYLLATGLGGVASWLQSGAAGYAIAILGHAFSGVRNAFAMNGAPVADLDFGWDGITAEQYLGSGTVVNSLGGGAYPDNLLTPAELVLAADAAAIVLHIGTNDLNHATAATTLARIAALAAALKQPGNVVFLCTLLPRTGNTTAPTVETFQSRIDVVNAGLADVAAETGCVLVSWHEELMDGAVANPDFFTDTTHPNPAGACRMGIALAAAIAPYVGAAYAVPAKGSAAWLNADGNAPYLDVDSNADGLADGLTAYYFSTLAASLETDLSGTVWQQIEEEDASTTLHAIFSPATESAQVQAAAGTSARFRAVCRYELVSGTVGGCGLFCEVFPEAGDRIVRATANYPTSHTPSLPAHGGLLLTEEFTLPATSHHTVLQFVFYGTGVFRLRQFGIFQVT